MNVPSAFSPSCFFSDVASYPPLNRKSVFSVMNRIKNSSNVLISNLYYVSIRNILQGYWNKLFRLCL